MSGKPMMEKTTMTRSRTFTPAALARRFREEESGVAAIEFAFIAPLLAVFLLGTTSVTQNLWANGKVGDLIAQESDLDDAKFNDIMAAGPVLMEPFPLEDLKIDVVAAIACHQDPDNTENSIPKMFVVWSNAWKSTGMTSGSGTPGDALRDSPQELSIEDGDYIVRTTVTYTHKPTISQKVGHEISMEELAYHQPRSNRPVSYPAKEGNKTQNCDDLMNRT
jgi:Flp pilus assembly protein TadG